MKWSLAPPTNTSPDHHRSWMMGPFDLSLTLGDVLDRSCVDTVILLIERFLNSEYLLVSKQDPFHFFFAVPLQEGSTFLHSCYLLGDGQHMASTTFQSPQSKVFFKSFLDSLPWNLHLQGQFSLGAAWISSNSGLQCLQHCRGPSRPWSVSSSSFNGGPSVKEPFNGPLDQVIIDLWIF